MKKSKGILTVEQMANKCAGGYYYTAEYSWKEFAKCARRFVHMETAQKFESYSRQGARLLARESKSACRKTRMAG